VKSYIIYAKRTAMGKLGGKLSAVRPDDLLAQLFKDFASLDLFDLKEIDDVLAGCANQAGEDNRNVARMASVLAGFPFEVPGSTLNRLCSSSLDATIYATTQISAGLSDCIVVGGVESMTRAPLVISKGTTAFGRDSKMYDTTFGWRFPNKKMKEIIPLYGMGETAEEIAKIHNISREEQDKYALSSHQKAIHAWNNDLFSDEILPIEVQLKKEKYLFSKDECPRSNTSIELLSNLKPVFRENGTVTAGNSSPMNDGASCVVIVSEKFLKDHNLKPLAEIDSAGIRGVHPNTMGLGPVSSTKLLCKKFGLKISDFDVVELNEAFAVQALACIKELNLNPNIVNLNGGAIALGHPLGCSGARILTTLTHIMQKNKNLKRGLATMCVGVGQGVSLSIKNC
jgi:acetyl-CoA acyltransferase